MWNYLQGLSLTASNKRWLASHLIKDANIADKEERNAELVFPKIPADYKPTEKVMSMTLGNLPKGVDLEKDIKDRWKEWAR